MESVVVSEFFREEVWSQHMPKQYVIPSITLKIDKKDLEYLTSDDTNPNPAEFSKEQEVHQAIQRLHGTVFAKFGNRSPKDCSSLDRKITSVKQLIMIAKMSEFITEGLSDQNEESEITLRQYCQLFEQETSQFRAYSIGGRLVGICQKNPSFLEGSITANQLSKLKQINSMIYDKICSKEEAPLSCKPEFVFDCYCSPSGHVFYLFSVEPFHLHALSLFTEQQLRCHYMKNKQNPKIKMIEHETQLKQIDLSFYSAGKELMDQGNARKWKDFMSGKPEEEE